MFNMGVYFDRGYGGEQDYELAAVYYRKAIEHGNDPGAAFNLGLLYQEGKISPQSNEQAADQICSLIVWAMIVHNII